MRSDDAFSLLSRDELSNLVHLNHYIIELDKRNNLDPHDRDFCIKSDLEIVCFTFRMMLVDLGQRRACEVELSTDGHVLEAIPLAKVNLELRLRQQQKFENLLERQVESSPSTSSSQGFPEGS